ncbi:hypothetical protein BAU08_04265 [Bordetella bronchialis]|uniref:Metal-binding protein n=2 Tax=Bordetella bronchialis TaxID=463025 RepID=A0A193FTJ4_9BORD|nr:hypothetical protein BAU08_04265 [Bordetella bronchialis]
MCGDSAMMWAWPPMPGRTWLDAASAFLGMWMAMMGAMMLPAVAPALWRYRRALSPMAIHRAGALVLLAGAAYFAMWWAAGIAVYLAGVAVTALRIGVPESAPAMPYATAAMVMAAGALQSSRWKARRLACCRLMSMPATGKATATNAAGKRREDMGKAIRDGCRLGLQCIQSCAGLTVALMAVGIMDPYAMVAATAAVALERLSPPAWGAASRIGRAIMVLGLFLMARAIVA